MAGLSLKTRPSCFLFQHLSALSWIVSGRDINGGEGSNPIYILVIRTWEEKSPPHKMSKKSEMGPARLRETFQVRGLCVCVCVCQKLFLWFTRSASCHLGWTRNMCVLERNDGLHVQTEGTVYISWSTCPCPVLFLCYQMSIPKEGEVLSCYLNPRTFVGEPLYPDPPGL